jgi:hypothetical protein
VSQLLNYLRQRTEQYRKLSETETDAIKRTKYRGLMKIFDREADTVSEEESIGQYRQ